MLVPRDLARMLVAGELSLLNRALAKPAVSESVPRTWTAAPLAPPEVEMKVDNDVLLPTEREFVPVRPRILPVWVRATSPLSQLTTPPSARKRSANCKVVVPSAATFDVLGTRLRVE